MSSQKCSCCPSLYFCLGARATSTDVRSLHGYVSTQAEQWRQGPLSMKIEMPEAVMTRPDRDVSRAETPYSPDNAAGRPPRSL